MKNDFNEIPLTLENPRLDPESRICCVSLPVPPDAPAYAGLGDIPTQTQPVGWWPGSLVGEKGRVRRQLMFALADNPVPEKLTVTTHNTGASDTWNGPEVSCRIIEKKNVGIFLNEVNEIVFENDGFELGFRLGLIHGNEYHWWEWVRLEKLWSGPLCRAFRAGGFIPVELFDEDYLDGYKGLKESPGAHTHNWLRGELFVLIFANGVIQLTCRHINNHFFDHGRDLEDVLPVIGLTPPGSGELPGLWDGTDTRFDMGGVSLNLDEASAMVGSQHPGRLAEEDGMVIYQPYSGVEITGDNHHRLRSDDFIVKAEEKLFPRGVARTVRFCASMGEAAPVISRLTVPSWWYARSRELWGDDTLAVHNEYDHCIEAAQENVRKKLAERLRCFDSAVLTRQMWEGETPYSQMLFYYLSGDPDFFDVAVNDSYHIADIGFDHATETMRMHNFPFGAIALPLFRTVAMTTAWLETGDPYLLECSESAATRFYWLDRHNWPRRSYGRDAASIRSLIFLWDYTGKEDYLEMAREALDRVTACQRQDGSYADQGSAVPPCGGATNEIIKPWMSMLANDPILDYLLRCPGDDQLENAVKRTADFMLDSQLELDGRYFWTYQYAYGDNPGDPNEMRRSPESYTPFPSPGQPYNTVSCAMIRFLFLATSLTGDNRYLDAWHRFYETVWSEPGQAPQKVGYTSNKMIQNLPFAQAHLWNARQTPKGISVRPMMTDMTPVMKGVIMTPYGALEMECTSGKDRFTVETRSKADFNVAVSIPGGGCEEIMTSNEKREFKIA